CLPPDRPPPHQDPTPGSDRSGASVPAVLDLTVVFHLVVVALRLGDQPVVADRPHFEPADPNPVAGAAGSAVRADEGPVVLDGVVAEHELVEEDLQVRERAHERPCDLGESRPAYRRLTAVDGQRAVRCVVGSDLCGVRAAPGIRIAARKVLELLAVERHRSSLSVRAMLVRQDAPAASSAAGAATWSSHSEGAVR